MQADRLKDIGERLADLTRSAWEWIGAGRYRAWWLLGGVAFLTAFLIAQCRPSASPGPRPSKGVPNLGRVDVMAYYVPRELGGRSGLAALRSHLSRIDTVIPFWYSVDGAGRLVGSSEEHVIQAVRAAGKRLVVMINNLDGTDTALRDRAVRRRAVSAIAALVENHKFDGVSIDFQLIPPRDRAGLTSFMTDLRAALNRKRSLEISVFPPVEVTPDVNAVYDYRALGRLVDRMVIMAYDRHYRDGPPGPIAPVDWVERNVLAAVELVPSRKLFLGVALYGYDWDVTAATTGEVVGAQEAIDRAAGVKAQIRWDDTSQEPFYRYYDRYGRRHDVWFESADAAVRKLGLAQKYALGGVAFWRLGFEQDQLWQAIR